MSAVRQHRHPAHTDCLHIVLATVLAVALGCGGTEATDENAAPTASAQVDRDTLTQAVSLDLSSKPALDAHVLFRGSCAGFRFDVQHPDGWQVSGTTIGLAKERTDAATFGIRVGDDFGSTHAESQLARLKREGARIAGTIAIGGQPVEVVSPRETTYHLFAPHPWGSGIGYFWLMVSSSLGDEATLRILNTLVPVAGC
jgi:hypothetical protein